MDKKTYEQIEAYMKSCMQDSAHDVEHIYRVLYTALDIAEYEKGVDHDVLICACLLHDIGRRGKRYATLWQARRWPEDFWQNGAVTGIISPK